IADQRLHGAPCLFRSVGDRSGIAHARHAPREIVDPFLQIVARDAPEDSAQHRPLLGLPCRLSWTITPAALLPPVAVLQIVMTVQAAHVGELRPLVATR